MKCPSRYHSQHEFDDLSPPAGQSPATTKEIRGHSPDSIHNSLLHLTSPCATDNNFDYSDSNSIASARDMSKRRYTSVDIAKIDLNSELERNSKKNASKHSLDFGFATSKHRKMHSLDMHLCSRSDLSDHLERKKRFLLAVRDRTPVRTKDLSVDHLSDDLVHTINRSENGLNDAISDTDIEKHDMKLKPKSDSSANTDLRHLQKEKVYLLHLLEQLDDGISSSDHENNENESDDRKDRRSKLIRTKFGDLGLVVSCQHDPMPLRKEAIVISAEREKDYVPSGDIVDPRIGRWKCNDRLLKCSSPNFSLSSGLLKTLSNSERLKRPPLERTFCKTDDDDNVGSDGVKSVSAADLLLKWRRKSSHSTNDSDIKHVNNLHKSTLHAIKSPSEPGYRLVTEAMRKRPMSLPLPQFAAEWLSSQNNLSKPSPKVSLSEVTSPKLKSPSLTSPPHAASSSPEFRCTKIKPPPLLTGCDKKSNSNPSILVSPPPKDSSDKNSLNLMSPPKTSLLSPPMMAKSKESVSVVDSSSDSEQSSPNRPSFEERIRALDEKFNVWSGSSRNVTPNAPVPSTTANVSETVSSIDRLKKRPRFTFLTTTVIR